MEGVCEQLLLPGLARNIGCNIEGKSISVIPVHGLSYVTISKLFGPEALRLKCSIITDGDPQTEVRAGPILLGLEDKEIWRTFPSLVPAEAQEAATGLPDETDFVKVFRNSVTLEYDLAYAGDNAASMVELWRSKMGAKAPELTVANLARLAESSDKAAFLWQSVCLLSGGKHKAAFAQELARIIEGPEKPFSVPDYIVRALSHVGCQPRPEAADAG